jgi:hypothetical protein
MGLQFAERRESVCVEATQFKFKEVRADRGWRPESRDFIKIDKTDSIFFYKTSSVFVIFDKTGRFENRSVPSGNQTWYCSKTFLVGSYFIERFLTI